MLNVAMKYELKIQQAVKNMILIYVYMNYASRNMEIRSYKNGTKILSRRWKTITLSLQDHKKYPREIKCHE